MTDDAVPLPEDVRLWVSGRLPGAFVSAADTYGLDPPHL